MNQAQAHLPTLLATLAPAVRPGRYVFVTSDDGRGVDDALASVVEEEGLSLVLRQDDADALGLDYDYVAGWITLTVHSALDAVGLTAAVSGALAGSGISCNVIAGRHHDHLLVPLHRVDDALAVLVSLSLG